MKLSEFLKVCNLVDVKPFENVDIGKDHSFERAFVTMMYSKAKCFQNSPVLNSEPDSEPDFYDLDETVQYAVEDHDPSGILNEFWIYGFGFCGCGDPLKQMADVAEYLKQRIDIISHTQPEHEFIAYECDRVGLTEHGSSIYGAWCEPTGWAFIVLCEHLKETK